MIGVGAIYSLIPEFRIETAPLAQAMGLSPDELDAEFGITHLARSYPSHEASDLCLAAVSKLLDAIPAFEPDDVDCVLVVTQNPDGYGIPHVAALVQRRLKLPEICATFDLGLGGSGYVYGLAVAKGFMEANGLRCGLLFTAEPHSRMIQDLDHPVGLLFGDAATVTVLSDKPKWTIGACDFGTAGVMGRTFEVRIELGGRLRLDFPAVRNFALERLPQSIARALKSNKLTMPQIDRLILPQLGRAFVDALALKLGTADKASFHAAAYGDTGCSAIPIALEQNLVPNDRQVLICGFGGGLSWASTVLTRSD